MTKRFTTLRLVTQNARNIGIYLVEIVHHHSYVTQPTTTIRMTMARVLMTFVNVGYGTVMNVGVISLMHHFTRIELEKTSIKDVHGG